MKISKVILCLLMCLTSFQITNVKAESQTKVGDANTNLALHKSGVSSSQQDATTSISNAFDENTTTRWASSAGKDGSGIDDTWIYVDLESEQEINKVVLNWESRPNKFKIQVANQPTDDWQDVTDVIDNGFLGGTGVAPGNKYINTVNLTETVKARYVKMQGIQRRRAEGDAGINSNTGYSLYEFGVYGPGWSDQTFVDEYTKTLTVKERISKNFKLPVKDETYGVTIEWNSNNEAIQVDGQGQATVTKGNADQEVQLTAKITRGDATKTQDFKVVVVATTQGKEYSFSPIPRSVLYGEDSIAISDEVNVVFEDSVSDITKSNYTDLLDELDMDYTQSTTIINDQTNIIIGVDDGVGIVDEYFENKTYDKTISTDVSEGYVLNIENESQIIAVLGKDDMGVKYASYTLTDILEQGDGNVRDLTIADSPEVEFRGFIEGFYGAEWSHENRKDLMEYGGRYKMNTYIYGPKSDAFHTGQWRDLYPENKLAELKELVDVGKKTGVEFVWAAHVGGKINLSSESDIQALKDKFNQLYGIGVRQFAIFFDDSATDNTQLVTFMNRMQHEYVDTKGDVKPLVFCPQYYNKKNGNENYLKNLRNFDKKIQIMWTGDFVVSEINQPVIDYIVDLIQRPVYIWWNYPVNDLGRAGLLHLGPTEALAPNIKNMSGLVSNPMNQAQANKPALYGIADYSWNSGEYDSDTNWKRGLKTVITDNQSASDAFEIFAQNCAAAPMSFPKVDESVYLKEDIKNFESQFLSGKDYSQEAQILKDHFIKIKASIDILNNYQGTHHISSEMKPWMDVVYKIADAGYYVLSELDNFDKIDKNNNESIQNAMKIIKDGRQKLYASNGSKKAAQKVLYPFIDNLLDNLDANLYKGLSFDRPYSGYGTAKTDYSLAFDGKDFTGANLDKYIQDDYFGVNLGKPTMIQNIEIIMTENNGSKKGYYKEGILEYSLDNQHWVEINQYNEPNIKVNDLNIEARFIRYRATDIFENEVTGENISSVVLKEFKVNKNKDFHQYTNIDNIEDQMTLTKKDNILEMSLKESLDLKEKQYIGVEFDQLKNIQLIKKSESLFNRSALELQSSYDGIQWQAQEFDKLSNFSGKYLRLINNNQQTVSLGQMNMQIQFAGKVELKASLSAEHTGSGDIYSGNVNNVVDGNEATTLWLKRGYKPNTSTPLDGGRYIQLEMPDTVPVYDIQTIYTGDSNNGGRIDISLDGKTWETVKTFGKVGQDVHNISLDGINTKFIRYYIDAGEWCQISEMYVNRSLNENALVISGDGKDLSQVVDGNILTSMKVDSAKGNIIYDCVNNINPLHFKLIKNADTEVKLEASIAGEWKEIAVLKDMYNDVDMTDYGQAQKFRVSWSEQSNVELYEISLIGTLSIDKTALQDLYDTKDDYNQSHYVEGTWNSFAEALIYAKGVLDNQGATQAEVDEAIDILTKAITNLQLKKADYSQLEVVKKDIPSDLSQYTKESVKNLNDVLDSIEMDLDITKQAIVDGYVKALQEAIAGLVLIPSDTVNKDELKSLIEICEKIDLGKYQQEGVEKFKEALKYAKSIYGKADATSEEVEAARTQLLNAKYALKEIEIKSDEDVSDVIETDDTSSMGGYIMMLFASAVLTIVIKKKYQKEC